MTAKLYSGAVCFSHEDHHTWFYTFESPRDFTRAVQTTESALFRDSWDQDSVSYELIPDGAKGITIKDPPNAA
jgi:hypothetical protein